MKARIVKHRLAVIGTVFMCATAAGHAFAQLSAAEGNPADSATIDAAKIDSEKRSAETTLRSEHRTLTNRDVATPQTKSAVREGASTRSSQEPSLARPDT